MQLFLSIRRDLYTIPLNHLPIQYAVFLYIYFSRERLSLSQVLLNMGLGRVKQKRKLVNGMFWKKSVAPVGSVEDAIVILQFLIYKVLWFLYITDRESR